MTRCARPRRTVRRRRYRSRDEWDRIAIVGACAAGFAAAEALLAEPAPRPRLGLKAAEFAPVPYFWTDQYDVRVQAYGLLSPGGQVHTEAIRGARLSAAALYGEDGPATGVSAANLPPRTVRAPRAVIAGPVPWDEAAIGGFKTALG